VYIIRWRLWGWVEKGVVIFLWRIDVRDLRTGMLAGPARRVRILEPSMVTVSGVLVFSW
jgi:hypothetical protein